MKTGQNLEEVVAGHVLRKEQPALLYRCKNTGEVATMREFADRIVSASRTPVSIDTAIGKVSYAAKTGNSYRGLYFERLPDGEQPLTKILRTVKRAQQTPHDLLTEFTATVYDKLRGSCGDDQWLRHALDKAVADFCK